MIFYQFGIEYLLFRLLRKFQFHKKGALKAILYEEKKYILPNLLNVSSSFGTVWYRKLPKNFIA